MSVFSIGEFSTITGLTVKTLRFYHERGILIPAHVDDETGYRYYAASQVEAARVVTQLRALEFSIEEIRCLLEDQANHEDMLDLLSRHKSLLAEKMQRHRAIIAALDGIIESEKEARNTMSAASFDVEEKSVDTMLIAGIRMQGKYADCGPAFGRIGRSLGRQLCGKCFLLHYDAEYQEVADFEACFPIRRGKDVDGISVRELPGGRCVSLLHKGPYEELRRSYARIMAYIKDKGYEVLLPTREVYVKGPGMILRGNPKNYLTEIQMLIKTPVS